KPNDSELVLIQVEPGPVTIAELLLPSGLPQMVAKPLTTCAPLLTMSRLLLPACPISNVRLTFNHEPGPVTANSLPLAKPSPTKTSSAFTNPPLASCNWLLEPDSPTSKILRLFHREPGPLTTARLLLLAAPRPI